MTPSWVARSRPCAPNDTRQQPWRQLPHYRRHPADYERKEAETRSQNNLPDTTPLVFLEVRIRDASEFYSPITITGHVG
ncbi:hypothetical protein [Corynebacterium diphtheriae]|uniref:hypothetical protein n=1 Tax=Corynebacterium diphtheriae TaxID=1717 RepID=UPI002174E709|nr:hypothetical protein [Corynebacterium diphtheriae]